MNDWMSDCMNQKWINETLNHWNNELLKHWINDVMIQWYIDVLLQWSNDWLICYFSNRKKLKIALALLYQYIPETEQFLTGQ